MTNIFAFALLAVVAAAGAVAEKRSYHGYRIVELSKESPELLRSLQDGAVEGLEVLKVVGESIHALVNKEAIAELRNVYTGRLHTRVNDVQALIDETTPSKSLPWGGVTSTDSAFFDEFRTYDEISQYVDELVANNTRILSKFVAGTTWEGRTIYGIKLATSTTVKPSIYFQALVHAREWLAPPTSLYALTALIEDYYAGDVAVGNLVEGMDWYFVPVVNIDGYLFTWSDDRLWRKNRRANPNGSFGVDINRNWGPEETWCTEGSSQLPSSDTYCGTAPFSEPETASMSNWINTLNDLRGAVDFHTYGPLILHPFQYSYDQAPEPYNGLVTSIGLEMEQAIRGVHGYPFESMQGCDLYTHSGGLIDYTYFTRGAYGFTIEMRGNSFIVPAGDIRLSGEEVYPGVLVLAENAFYASRL